MIADFCSLVKANREGENRGKEKRINTRKNYGSEVNSIARRGQGGIPLAGSRDSVPCGAWGNAPTVTPLNLLKEKSQAWHLGRRQRSVPAHKLPLPQERNPPSAKKVNYGSVRCEGVKGATADFVCFHCPLVASTEAKPLQQYSRSLKENKSYQKRTLPSQTSTNLEVLFHHERYHHA